MKRFSSFLNPQIHSLLKTTSTKEQILNKIQNITPISVLATFYIHRTFFVNITVMDINGRQHKFRLQLISIAGATLIVVNRLVLNNIYINIMAGIMLITASFWNSLSVRMSNSFFDYSSGL